MRSSDGFGARFSRITKNTTEPALHSEDWRDRAPRRTLIVLAIATAVGSAGLAAGGTAGALLGAEIAGAEAAAGLPLGALVVGQAAAALLVSGATHRAGRGASLALGYVLRALGAVLCFALAALLLTAVSTPSADLATIPPAPACR